MTRLRGQAEKWERPEGVPEGSVLSVFRVPPEDAGQRLDVFLAHQLKRTSRTRTQHIIKMSAFDGEGRPLRSNDRVYAEQHVLLWRAPWDEDAEVRDIPILYEDDVMMAVDKPADLPVHPTARYFKSTLLKQLEAKYPGQFLSLVHRIDRETSGVLLVAKTREADRRLKKQLENRTGVEKTYRAITWGVPKSEGGAREFRCDLPLELDVAGRYRVKMRVGRTPQALSAGTRFMIEETRTRGDGDRVYSLMRCDLETGRQHQIRVHLASLGAPIVGDKLYGPDESCFARGADGELTDEDRALMELPRHALHAARLVVRHPMTDERLEIISEIPEDLRHFWASLTPG